MTDCVYVYVSLFFFFLALLIQAAALARKLLYEGEVLQRHGNFTAALEKYEAALKLHPTSLAAKHSLDALRIIIKYCHTFDWKCPFFTMPRGIEFEFKASRSDTQNRVVGERVELYGLVARPELNGLKGVVAEEYDQVTGRFTIRLDPIGSLEIEASKLVQVKCTNLLDSFSDDPN